MAYSELFDSVGTIFAYYIVMSEVQYPLEKVGPKTALARLEHEAYHILEVRNLREVRDPRAKDAYYPSVFPMISRKITISWNYRMRRTAGDVRISGRNQELIVIRLAHGFFEEFGFDRSQRTLRHEMAHVLDNIYNGSTGHGESFKKLCVELGGSMNSLQAGTRYAEAAETRWLHTDVWEYTCKCGNSISRSRRFTVRQMQRNWCKGCKAHLYTWVLKRLK